MGKDVFWLFMRATWRYKWRFIIGEIAATIFVLSADILIPLIIANIVQKLTEVSSQNLVFADFTTLIWQLVGAMVVRFLMGRVMLIIYFRMEPLIIRDLEVMSFQKLSEHSMDFYANSFTGALVAKVNRMTAAYQRFIETMLGDIGMTIRIYLFYIVVLFALVPQIATIMLIWSVFFCFIVYRMHRYKMRFSKQAAADDTLVTATIADAITNMLTIRLFSSERLEKKRFGRASNKRKDSRIKNYMVGEYIRIVKAVLMRTLDVVVIIMTIRLVVDGSMDIGTAVLVQLYLANLLNRLWDFGRYFDRIEESFANASEMVEVLNEPIDINDPEQPEAIKMANGNLRFEHVSFTYKDAAESERLFKDLDLEIPSGQRVGLVGPSGGGKSTFTKLVLRLMDVQKGHITIDGQDISAVTQSDLRRQVAYVPQEPLLFHRSILENIQYGNPGASEKEVIETAKKAHAWEFIKTLPKGMDTLVGERGVKLSGGQKQRVAIARAMLKKSPIIILDEATSSLDSESEHYITAALDKLMENRTTIVIAHRLSTIKKMDRILVFDKGRLAEDGSHNSLVKKKGLYARLWKHQHGDFLDG